MANWLYLEFVNVFWYNLSMKKLQKIVLFSCGLVLMVGCSFPKLVKIEKVADDERVLHYSNGKTMRQGFREYVRQDCEKNFGYPLKCKRSIVKEWINMK